MTRSVVLSLSLSLTVGFAQDFQELLDKDKKPTGIESNIVSNLSDAALKGGQPPGNQIWSTTVTLKETSNLARRLVVCLHGASIVLSGRIKAEGLRPITLVRKGNNLECEIAEKGQNKDRFFGNLGCQNVSLGAKATLKLVYVTAARPAPDSPDEAPVQDGNYREANGPGGPFGAGHRQFASAARYSKLLALRAALDDLLLNVAILGQPAIKMGCVKKGDAPNTKKDNDANRPAYAPADCAEIAKEKTCNRCFGMNTHMVIGNLGANVTQLPEVAIKYNTIKSVALREIPLNGERALATNATATVNFVPAPGSPNPFSPCDTGSPGCFAMTPPLGSPFPVPEGANQYGVLTINFPDFLSNTFAGTFFVSLTSTNGELLSTSRIPVKKDLTCDVNGDGLINVQDINEIMSVLGAAAEANDPADSDGNGTVTIADARACVLKCSKSNCVE